MHARWEASKRKRLSQSKPIKSNDLKLKNSAKTRTDKTRLPQKTKMKVKKQGARKMPKEGIQLGKASQTRAL